MSWKGARDSTLRRGWWKIVGLYKDDHHITGRESASNVMDGKDIVRLRFTDRENNAVGVLRMN